MGSTLFARRRGLAPLAALALALLAGACGPVETVPRIYTFQGRTMGTTYTVKVVGQNLSETRQRQIQGLIQAELEGVNVKMSHYLPDSELSRFNRFHDTTPFRVSKATLEVFQHAQDISALTDGAFDITVGPLVNTWGFGPDGRPTTLPSDEQIARLTDQLGYTKLELDLKRSTVRKREPFLAGDLSAIAKGYAVDQVAEALEGEGLSDHMVEVGGEVRTGGVNDGRHAWRIAIERPDSETYAVHRIVPLSSLAMATSGDYRNSYDVEGRRVSHMIDPRTGHPVTHQLASVSVVDELCVRADGLATALAVLGPDEGYDLAVAQNLAVLFIVRSDERGFRERATPTFERLVEQRAVPVR